MDRIRKAAVNIIEPLIRTTARMSLRAESTRERARKIVRRLSDAGLLADDLSRVSRVEVIVPGHGRLHSSWNACEVETSLQDDGRTLKVFYREVGDV